MQLFEYGQVHFPETTDAVNRHIQYAERATMTGSVAIFGGSARSALLEVISGIVRPIRDVDMVAIGDDLNDEKFAKLIQQLNPKDAQHAGTKVPRYSNIPTLIETNTDFTINGSALKIGERLRLVTTPDAIQACESKTIKPTQERIAQTKQLQAQHKAAPHEVAPLKRFRRNQSNMPARAAYFAAVLQAAGHDFDVDMLNHPIPTSPNDSHTFFLGLMVEKALQVDEVERGAGDMIATRHLFNMFEKIGLTKGVNPATDSDVVTYLETVNDEHPQFKPTGSQIAQAVKLTNKQPAPRVA